MFARADAADDDNGHSAAAAAARRGDDFHGLLRSGAVVPTPASASLVQETLAVSVPEAVPASTASWRPPLVAALVACAAAHEVEKEIEKMQAMEIRSWVAGYARRSKTSIKRAATEQKKENGDREEIRGNESEVGLENGLDGTRHPPQNDGERRGGDSAAAAAAAAEEDGDESDRSGGEGLHRLSRDGEEFGEPDEI